MLIIECSEAIFIKVVCTDSYPEYHEIQCEKFLSNYKTREENGKEKGGGGGKR